MPPRACKAGPATQWNLIQSAPHITPRPHIRSGLIHSRGRIYVRPIYSGASVYSAAAHTVGGLHKCGRIYSGPHNTASPYTARPHTASPYRVGSVYGEPRIQRAHIADPYT